jgi:hypothetical protein
MHGGLTPHTIARSITGKKIDIVKLSKFFKQIKIVKRKFDIYRYGVETTTLSEMKVRSTAHATTVITHMDIYKSNQ